MNDAPSAEGQPRRAWNLMLDADENVLGIYDFESPQGYGDTWTMTTFFEDNMGEEDCDPAWKQRRLRLVVGEDDCGLAVLAEEEDGGGATVVPIIGSLWDQLFAPPGSDQELDGIILAEMHLKMARAIPAASTDSEDVRSRELRAVMAHEGATQALRTLDLDDLRRADGIDVTERKARSQAVIDGVLALVPDLQAAYARADQAVTDLLEAVSAAAA